MSYDAVQPVGISGLTPEQVLILRRIVQLAPQIRNNKQLKQIIRHVNPAERRAFYGSIRRHLSFKPAPYWLIK